MTWKVTLGNQFKVTVSMAKRRRDSRVLNTMLPYLVCVETHWVSDWLSHPIKGSTLAFPVDTFLQLQLDGTASGLPSSRSALLLVLGNGAPVCCGSCTHQAIDQPIPSCAELRSPSLGLNLPLSYTNMALAHFYCCKLFMRGMLNLKTEV